jgi:hypothetical protein
MLSSRFWACSLGEAPPIATSLASARDDWSSNSSSDLSRVTRAGCRLVETARQVGQVAGQDLPQPPRQLGFVAAAKLAKTRVRFQQRLLHHVGRIRLIVQGLLEGQCKRAAASNCGTIRATVRAQSALRRGRALSASRRVGCGRPLGGANPWGVRQHERTYPFHNRRDGVTICTRETLWHKNRRCAERPRQASVVRMAFSERISPLKKRSAPCLQGRIY